MRIEGDPQQTWAERYEALRSTAAAACRARHRGLALFLRHGLAGWMAAWRTLVGATSDPVAGGVPAPTVPPDLRAELAGTLASMALRGSSRKGATA